MYVYAKEIQPQSSCFSTYLFSAWWVVNYMKDYLQCRWRDAHKRFVNVECRYCVICPPCFLALFRRFRHIYCACLYEECGCSRIEGSKIKCSCCCCWTEQLSCVAGQISSSVGEREIRCWIFLSICYMIPETERFRHWLNLSQIRRKRVNLSEKQSCSIV
jgi:hypothetical protein